MIRQAMALNLNFHGIGAPTERAFGPGEQEFWATPETFDQTLDRAAAHPGEIVQGRETLEQLTKTPVDTVAIPYGAYNQTVLDALKQHDYTHVYTSDGGPADPGAWLQPREHVRAQQLS